jgi:hypothetical protein
MDLIMVGIVLMLTRLNCIFWRSTMITEIDLLKEEIPRLELKFGTTNAFVELLKAHLAFLQNQTKPVPQNDPFHWHNGIGDSN